MLLPLFPLTPPGLNVVPFTPPPHQEPTLRVLENDHVFALGDVSGAESFEAQGTSEGQASAGPARLPATAQVGGHVGQAAVGPARLPATAQVRGHVGQASAGPARLPATAQVRGHVGQAAVGPARLPATAQVRH